MGATVKRMLTFRVGRSQLAQTLLLFRLVALSGCGDVGHGGECVRGGADTPLPALFASAAVTLPSSPNTRDQSGGSGSGRHG